MNHSSRPENTRPGAAREEQFAERLLGEHLRGVEAPAGLWHRIQNGPAQRPAPALWTGRPIWAAAAAAAVLAIGFAGWRLAYPPQSVEALAVEALDHTAEQLDLVSPEPAQIRKWLREKAGVDVPLPPMHSPSVEIIGAKILQGNSGTKIAEISYRVGDAHASLLVLNDPRAERSYPNHQSQSSGQDPEHRARVSQWNMRGQVYTLASAAPAEFGACQLCHTGNEPQFLQ